jgi:hypothetical protein
MAQENALRDRRFARKSISLFVVLMVKRIRMNAMLRPQVFA